MRALSKSKLMAYRQCAKRLWLEVHRPELRQDSASTQMSFHVGNIIGDVARRIYDPGSSGTIIDLPLEGIPAAIERTQHLLDARLPIFEASFSAAGGFAA